MPSNVGWSIAVKASGSCSLEALLGEHDAGMVALDRGRDPLGVPALVVGGDVEPDGERVHGSRRDLAREHGHGARVDPAGQKDAERDVGDELHPDRVQELAAQVLGRGRTALRRGQLPVLSRPTGVSSAAARRWPRR